ncbi:MAG: AAA family ATPase [Spirochaetales bacterium]|nr:AAA family ATPase [Spirochaetales bacterium]
MGVKTIVEEIVNVKNLGIFSDYKWDSTLPYFKPFNLIYGENGSGKTTHNG